MNLRNIFKRKAPLPSKYTYETDPSGNEIVVPRDISNAVTLPVEYKRAVDLRPGDEIAEGIVTDVGSAADDTKCVVYVDTGLMSRSTLFTFDCEVVIGVYPSGESEVPRV